MDARFTQRDDRVVDLQLGPEWGALEETLQDAVTTRAPRGSDGVNPSTYWIDRTLRAIALGPDGTIVASGNMSDLVLDGEELVARSQHEMFDDQRVHRLELVELLGQWRALVVDLRGGQL